MRATHLVATVIALSTAGALAACGSDSGPGDAPPPPHADGGSDASDGAAPQSDAAKPDASDAYDASDVITPPQSARVQGGGDTAALALVDHRAYVGVGPRLTIWDLTNPAAPTKLGESEPLDADLTGVAVVGTHAYVTEHLDLDGSLVVIDVANPAAPKLGTKMKVVAAGQTTMPMGVAADAAHVYVADQEHGIAVLDLVDPSTPKLQKSIDLSGVTGIQIVGTRLYATFKGFIDDYALEAFDLSASLADLGGASFSGAGAVAITQSNIAVSAGINGIQVKDLSDLKNPKDWTVTGPAVNSLAVAAGGGAIWIPAFDGLYAMDLSTPGTAKIGARIDALSDGTEAVAVVGSLFTATTNRGRLLTIDVSAPQSPVVKATVDTSLCSDCGGVSVDGDHLYVADHAGGVRAGTLADLAHLGRDATAERVDVEGLAVHAGKAYAADWWFGLRIFDVADPTKPKALGAIATGGKPSSVAYEDGFAYVGESTNGGALRVVDVSDPAKPAIVGSVATSFALHVVVRNKKVFVADKTLNSAGGLHIFDTTDPKAIKQIGSYTDCGDVYYVSVDGNTAAVACEKGWDIVDITTLTAPKKLGHVDVASPNSATSTAISGSRAYLGSTGGMIAFDITNPASPQKVTERATPFDVEDLLITKPGHVVAACGMAGVYQWDIP